MILFGDQGAEEPFPTGYERGRRHIRHIHVKDVHVDIPRATVQFRALGTGHLAPYLVDIAAALRRDGYLGVVSLEANYQPTGDAPGSSFAASVEHFRRVFGDRACAAAPSLTLPTPVSARSA